MECFSVWNLAWTSSVVLCTKPIWHGHWHSRLNLEGIQSRAIVTCKDLFECSFPFLCTFHYLMSVLQVYLCETNTVLFLITSWIQSTPFDFPLKYMLIVVHLCHQIGTCLQQTHWHTAHVLASVVLAYGKANSLILWGTTLELPTCSPRKLPLSCNWEQDCS